MARLWRDLQEIKSFIRLATYVYDMLLLLLLLAYHEPNNFNKRGYFLSFITDSIILLFFIMLVLLKLLVVVLVVMMILLLVMLLLVYYEENNIAYSNGVLAVDEGKKDTELTFSCNIRSTTTSINNYIYSTPAVQAEDNGFYNTQLVL